ncbi:MAG: TolC family protein [Myxococcota bacterium]
MSWPRQPRPARLGAAMVAGWLVLVPRSGSAQLAAAPDDDPPAPASAVRSSGPAVEDPNRHARALLERIDAPLGLRLAEAIARAVARAPAVARQKATAEAAEADVDAAFVGLMPRTRATLSYTHLSDVDNPPLGPAPIPVIRNNFSAMGQIEYSLSALFLSGLDGYAATKRQRDAEDLQVRVEEAAVAFDTQLAYLDAVAADVDARALGLTLARFRAFERQVAAQRRAGTATQADTLAASSRTQLARAALEGNRIERRRARRALRLLVGKTPRGPRRRAVLVLPGAPKGSVDASVRLALGRRVEPAVVDQRIAAAENLREATSGRRWPDLSASATMRNANPNPRILPPVEEFRFDWSVGVALSFSLSNHFAVKAETARASAQVSALKEQREDLRRAIRRQVIDAHAAWRSLHAQRQPMHAAYVAAAEAHRLREVAYAAGTASSQAVFDALDEFRTAEQRFVGVLIGEMRAKALLRFAEGRLGWARPRQPR